MEKPPVSTLEKSSYHHWIVTLANIAFVVGSEWPLLFIECKVFLLLSHVIKCALVKSFLKDWARDVFIRLKLVFCIQYFAQMQNYLFFYSVWILSNFQGGRHETIPRELNSKSLAYLDCIRDILESTLLGDSSSEDNLRELIVVWEHPIYWVSHVLEIVLNFLDNFDFCRRVFIWVVICNIIDTDSHIIFFLSKLVCPFSV